MRLNLNYNNIVNSKLLILDTANFSLLLILLSVDDRHFQNI